MVNLSTHYTIVRDKINWKETTLLIKHKKEKKLNALLKLNNKTSEKQN
jgi:hypothetical protein